MGNDGLVYIILVNYNCSELTLECISSLEKINYNNYKIVVVDNASNKEDYKKLSEIKSQQVVIIRSEENLGFAGGNNIGIRYAQENNAEFVLLLNNDTVVEKNFLKEMVKVHTSNSSVGIVCPKIYDYENKNLLTYAGGDIDHFKGTVKIDGLNKTEQGKYDVDRDITFASGCCMLISSEVLNKTGFLQEDYFLYFEDTDYSVRVVKSGYKLRYCHKAKIYHNESSSTKKNSGNFQYYFIRNRLMFIKNNFTKKNKVTAYLVTIIWAFKYVITKDYQLENFLEALKDFKNGHTGKRKQL